MNIHTRNTEITPRKHMLYTVISNSLFMSKLVSMVNKDKVLYMSPIKQEYNSSVVRHVLANQKVWGSILSQGMPFLFVLY